mgnify:FL=1
MGPVFEVAPYTKKEAMVLTDKEATIQQFMLVYSSKKSSPNVTLEDYRNSIVRSMFFAALNNRMAKLTESSNPPYLAAYMGVGGWARVGVSTGGAGRATPVIPSKKAGRRATPGGAA